MGSNLHPLHNPQCRNEGFQSFQSFHLLQSKMKQNKFAWWKSFDELEFWDI